MQYKNLVLTNYINYFFSFLGQNLSTHCTFLGKKVFDRFCYLQMQRMFSQWLLFVRSIATHFCLYFFALQTRLNVVQSTNQNVHHSADNVDLSELMTYANFCMSKCELYTFTVCKWNFQFQFGNHLDIRAFDFPFNHNSFSTFSFFLLNSHTFIFCSFH